MENLVESILNEELKRINPELKQYMVMYICNSYKKMLEEIKNNPASSATPFFIEVIKKECDDILSLNIEEQKSIIVPDKYYEELQRYTNKIYYLAMKKKDGNNIQNVSEQEKQIILNNIELLKSRVQPFNINNAERLISECILELNYVMTDTDIMSLRMR